jgi:hypothetical protein
VQPLKNVFAMVAIVGGMCTLFSHSCVSNAMSDVRSAKVRFFNELHEARLFDPMNWTLVGRVNDVRALAVEYVIHNGGDILSDSKASQSAAAERVDRAHVTSHHDESQLSAS